MKFFLALAILCVASAAEGRERSLKSVLRKFLLMDYDRQTIPDGIPQVKYGHEIVNMHLCPHRQQLSIKGWMKMTWTDKRLVWNTSQWGGIDTLRVHHNDIWRPDITIYNSVGVMKPTNPIETDRAVVYATGMVIHVPAVQHEVLCEVNFEGWPFSKQNCTLKIGSWTLSTKLLDIVPWGDTAMDVTPINFEYMPKNMIEILGSGVTEVEKTYKCCPDEIYKHLAVNIQFRNKGIFHHGKFATNMEEFMASSEEEGGE